MENTEIVVKIADGGKLAIIKRTNGIWDEGSRGGEKSATI